MKSWWCTIIGWGVVPRYMLDIQTHGEDRHLNPETSAEVRLAGVSNTPLMDVDLPIVSEDKKHRNRFGRFR